MVVHQLTSSLVPARRFDRPTHRGGNFAARRYLYACHHRFVNGYESTDQVREIVPVPPMEMKGNGTVLEHPTTPSASEEQPCPVSTSRQFAGRSRWSRCWTCSASSPRHDRGCSGMEAVRCTPPRRAIAARSPVNVALGCYYCHGCRSHGNQLELWAAATKLPLHQPAIDLCHRLGRDVPWIRRWR